MKPRALQALTLFFAATAFAAQKPVTVDDLMAMRWIAGVQISPDGQRVAYVLSQPNVETDTHDATLYVVPAAGGTPVRMNYGTRIFNVPPVDR